MIEYDAHNWRNHLLDIKGSMVREIFGRVSACVAWSAIVVLIHRYVIPVNVTPTVHSIVGVALGLLLVFRTNASYDRFWEGRRQWGSIVNESRNLARASRVLLKDEPALHAQVVRWTVAFAYAAMDSLRGKKGGLGPVGDRLPGPEVEAVLATRTVPLAVAVRISNLLNEARTRGRISDYVQMTIDQNVQLLIDYFGACQRIQKTPLPYPYVVHLRRSLILFFWTLPAAIVEPFGWRTIIVTLLVAYIFFGIEEIGVEIEEPFGDDENDLPLEQICATIEADLLALIDGEGRPGEALTIAS